MGMRTDAEPTGHGSMRGRSMRAGGASPSTAPVAGDQPAGGLRWILRGSLALCAMLMAGGLGLAAVRWRTPGTR